MLILLSLIYCSNNKLSLSYLTFQNKNVKSDIKIVHISDMHLHYFGKDNKTFLKKIEKEKPDLIFVTGDMCCFSDENLKIVNKDSKSIYDMNMKYVIETLNLIRPIAPTFFCLGNHEHVFEKFDISLSRFKQTLGNIGVNLLINEFISFNINDNQINILGADNSYYQDIYINELVENFEKLDGVKIILDHYPTNFSLNGRFSYCNFDIDFVFSGHEHGRQIRIPFIGSLYSHYEGLFPTYAEGIHTENNSTLIVSRGLGNSTFPIRLFNLPELIIVSLIPE